jgi:hypothetical protein
MSMADEQQEKGKKEVKVKGLKSMRAGRTSGTPDYDCPNCKCKRYSPCGCTKATKQ